MSNMAPGADGSAHAGHELNVGTARGVSGEIPPSCSRSDGRTIVDGKAKMPSLAVSATPTKVAVEPGVETMSIGSAPIGRKFAPGIFGFSSMTGSICVVMSTTAISPREVWVTIA